MFSLSFQKLGMRKTNYKEVGLVNVMKKEVLAMLSLITPASFGAGGAFADPISGGAIDDVSPYTKSDIIHAFVNMDLFVIPDDDYQRSDPRMMLRHAV